MSEATARPWTVKGGVLIFQPIQFSRDQLVAEAFHETGFIDRNIAEANAALIVKAVNAHSLLVEALEEIQVQTQDPVIERLCAAALEEARA